VDGASILRTRCLGTPRQEGGSRLQTSVEVGGLSGEPRVVGEGRDKTMSVLLTEAASQAAIVEAVQGLPPSRARRLLDRRDLESRQGLLRRVRCEFQEMPGLHLTLPQAARLFSLDLLTCQRVLSELVSAGWLCLTSLGTYARAGPQP
jgi:hypothetical protein